MQEQKRKYILDLIDQLQAGNISDEEIKYLSNFYVRHQESSDWPLDLESKYIIKEKIFDNIQDKIQGSTEMSVKTVPLYRHHYFKYGLAASLLLIISITLVLNQNSSSHKNEFGDVNAQIHIGTDKAILTLDNGTSISLEDHQPYKAKDVSSNDGTLVYHPNIDSLQKEISYNVLTIPRGGQFFVQLSDGTKIWLNSDSQLRYPVQFIQGKPREVELVYGEAYFKVSSSTDHNGAIFTVQSQLQKIAVVGTEFNVSAYPEDTSIYTTLVEGKVILKINDIEKALVPNDQARINRNTSNIQIESVDVYRDVSWKEGIFSFHQMPLKDIMKVMGRWYDVEVYFENPSLETVKFNGVLKKDQRLEDIMEIIKSTNNLDFQIKNKTIIIK